MTGKTHEVQPSPLLETEALEVHFTVGGGLLRRFGQVVRAVDGVTLSVDRGTTMGVVGESGSGKSTLGRALVGIHRHTGGSLRFDGTETSAMDRDTERIWRSSVQMIFQDPFDALNPRMTVGMSIAEPLVAHRWGDRSARRERVLDLLELVGMDADVADRYPHEFSGGQLQRVVIARAIALHPSLVVCDEPTSALDVSTQANILNLLKRLQRELGLTYVFISHDLGVVRQVADTVAVMYGGKLAEVSPAAQLFDRPLHPYAAGLMSAVPGEELLAGAERRPLTIEGETYDPAGDHTGCNFAPRCPFATRLCREVDPPLTQALDDRHVACVHWEQLHADRTLDVFVDRVER